MKLIRNFFETNKKLLRNANTQKSSVSFEKGRFYITLKKLFETHKKVL